MANDRQDRSAIDLMHGEEWDGQQDLNGWWLSEKMDGVRAYWNGEKLIAKQGKKIDCPNWFTEGLPSGIKLDGELWLGRGQYENTMSMLKDNGEDLWKT